MSKNKPNDFNTKPIFSEVKDDEIVIKSEKIVEEPKEVVKASPKIKRVKKNIQLRVRDAASVDGNVLRMMGPGTDVFVYKEENGWSKISKDFEEYVMTDYLD